MRGGICALSVTLLFVAASACSAQAQEAPDGTVRPLPRPAELVPALEDAGLTDEELDELVAPVALFPDSLLAQVLVAATYPLDVMKSVRFLEESVSLGDKERAEAAATQPWDPSVQILAGGFPTVIARMAKDIDWTETLGNAVLARTEGVLAAVQRMRARAEAMGNLESNEAQVVETNGESITIEPADPDIVYVPDYDAAAAFVPNAQPATVVTDGVSSNNLLVTGAIAFGSALLLDEIFDDDDDWDDYWRGPPPFDWDNDDFYPRRDIDVDGDVNIDVDRDRVRIGDGERPLADRDGAWQASPERREEAREQLAARQSAGGGATRADAGDKLRARSSAADSGARAKLEAAGAKRGPATMPGVMDSALTPKREGPTAAKRASERGATSADKDRVRSAAEARPRSVDKPKSVSTPRQAKPAAKRAPPQSTAFKKTSGGGKARASSSRGNRSGGGRRR